MKLLHYSKNPLRAIYSREHDAQRCGYAKTTGLWVSVEGDEDCASGVIWDASAIAQIVPIEQPAMSETC